MSANRIELSDALRERIERKAEIIKVIRDTIADHPRRHPQYMAEAIFKSLTDEDMI